MIVILFFICLLSPNVVSRGSCVGSLSCGDEIAFHGDDKAKIKSFDLSMFKDEIFEIKDDKYLYKLSICQVLPPSMRMDGDSDKEKYGCPPDGSFVSVWSLSHFEEHADTCVPTTRSYGPLSVPILNKHSKRIPMLIC